MTARSRFQGCTSIIQPRPLLKHELADNARWHEQNLKNIALIDRDLLARGEQPAVLSVCLDGNGNKLTRHSLVTRDTSVTSHNIDQKVTDGDL